MAYNYAAAYGTTYGQYNQQQPSAYSSQQTSTAGYGQYGQTSAAYGTAGSASATTTTASNVNTYNYASATPGTTTTAQSTYNYGYNYNYGTDTSSGYSGITTPASSALQVFQQNWYNNTSGSATSTQQQAASTSQTSTLTTQQQQYGQYIQQYQQQLTAYQQYANNNAGSSSQQQQQGLFKTPPAAGARSSVTQAKTDSTQQATGWNAYSQNQQSTAQTANRTDPTKTGWGAYNQQQNMGTQQQQQQQQTNATGNQQKPTNIVYRTPMKYPNDATQYGATNVSQNYSPNQQYKPPNPTGNTNQQGYGNMNQNYNTGQQQQQGYNTGGNQGYGNSQSYSSPQTNQMYNANQQMYKPPQPTNYNAGNQGFQPNQNYGGNFNNTVKQGNFNNKGYGMGMNNNQMGGNNMQGQRNNVRPMGNNQQRSPMNNNNPGYNQGPRDGPSIPPFPRAWHSQDNDGPRPQDNWQGQRGFGDQRDQRWGRGGGNMGPRGRGYGNQQQQQQQPPQQRGMYNNNSRHARGASGSNRELWSPAVKKGTGSTTSSKSDEKTTPRKEEFEVIDKDKHPEIKTFLYAWLGARHTRPTYDIRQIGERPSISFRCDLRVDNYNFVGVGKATSKKEAQTTAAWKFGEYLVKIGELKESELPNKLVKTEETEGEIGDVKEEGENRRNDQNRNRQGQNRQRRNNRDRPGNQNWGSGNQGRPQMQNEIPALMALPLGPMGGPPPHMMGPPPPFMDYGPHPHWDDGWGGLPMGPSMGMRPPMMMMRQGPPPFMRRNQNDFWRRRDIEERMMDLSRGNDRMHPEDMFINQMIRNQQEGERKRRGGRGPMANMPPATMEATPGEWERVQQTRPIVSADDRHVMSKHSEVYPQEGELKNLHRIVNCVEQALKLLSDKFVDQDHPREEGKKDDSEEFKDEETKREVKEGEEKDDYEEADEGDKSEKKKDEEENADEKKDEGEKADEKKDEGDKAEEKRAKIKILKRPKKVAKQVDTRPRVLCGVNRIGPLAKGLLITRDDHVDLALLCGEIPTVKLFDRIMEQFADKLVEVDEEFKLIVIQKQEEAGFLIKTIDESSPVEVMVTLTAMALRKPTKKEQEEKDDDKKEAEKEDDKTKMEEDDDKKEKSEMDESKEETPQEKEDDNSEKKEEVVEEPDPEGMLPKRKMLDALACLRHTHWFQAKACNVHSCVILSRILRDLQRRDELWNHLSEWALEVLIFSCLTSSEEQMSPGDACRRFFEVIAGGLLLPGMPGILDPCEKGLQNDVLDCLSEQDREDITRSAQRFLRHLAFREIHIILGMEKLPPTYRMDNNFAQRSFKNQSNESTGVEEKERGQNEPNNLRKRRFEHNGSDSVAESPKRSLTDEEDTDTQQNLAELSISDEASEGRSAALDEEENAESKEKKDKTEEQTEKEKDDALLEKDVSMDLTENKVTEEEDALLEEDMDT